MKSLPFFHQNYGVIIFVFAGILIVPQLYYLSNIEEFSHDLLLASLPTVAALFVFFLGIFFHPREKVQLFLSGLGLSILLCDQFIRLDLGFLDGSTKEIHIDPTIASINALVYFGLPLYLVIFGGRFKKLLADLAFALMILGLSVTFYSIYSSLSYSSGNNATNKHSYINQNKADEKLPNVYFIWLDAMESGYMEKYLDSSGAHESFTGFTFFKNNSANYLYTAQSYPSFMSGTLYKGESYHDWSNQGDNLRKNLNQLGYRITNYAKKDFLSDLNDIAYSSDELYLKWTANKHPFITDFMTYWLVRSLPGFFSNYSLKIGSNIGGKVFSWFNVKSKYSKVKSIADGIQPLSGVFTLKQLIADEDQRETNNEFVIAQAIIPHGPYVIDKNCHYRGKSKKVPSKTYYEQVQCSANLVEKFLNKLQKLNRYDSSLIIIMGDHGAGWAGLIEGFKDDKKPLNIRFTPWSKSMVISRSSALLMVKPPNTSNNIKLKTSFKESQLVDIYPTILSLIGYSELVPENIDGINLLDDDVTSKRSKYITYFKPSKIINPYEAEIYDLNYSLSNGLVNLVYRSNLKTKNDISSITCSQTIDFSPVNDFPNYYFSTGLSGIETWGRWSNSKSVQLEFKFQQGKCTASKITFNLKGFVSKVHPVQLSRVTLNQKVIGNIIIKVGEKNPRDFVLNIPPSLIKTKGINVLEFMISNPISPKDIGISDDSRLLGLGFHSMTFQ